MSVKSHPLLVRAVELRDPLAALDAFAGLPYAFVLHSGLTDERSRWSFFGADPFAVFRSGDVNAALAAFRALAPAVARDVGLHAPFTGGLVGYWSYDFGRRLERLPEVARDDLGLPDFVLGAYDVIGAHDHRTGETLLFSSGLPHEGAAREDRARARLEDFATRLARAAARPDPPRAATPPRGARSTFLPDAYRRAVETVKEHIRRGDIFQANLSQRWTVDLTPGESEGLGPELFRALAADSPAPFAAYLDAGDHRIVSASPERFLELRGRTVETRPIKGTRPRGSTAAEDARLGAELLASAKDRAENVMIVDVLRNDLGRVCEPGTVETRGLCELEAFPQVFHLTSTVRGRLRAGLDAFDLVRAAFPGGSITGAPKIRAQEILETLEPVRRHIYTGSVGYVDWSGDADWSIAIRTALVTPRAAHFAAGGGITADSDPDAELAETLHKAEGMRLALSRVLGPVELEAAALRA